MRIVERCNGGGNDEQRFVLGFCRGNLLAGIGEAFFEVQPMHRGVVIVLLDVRLNFGEHFLSLGVTDSGEFSVGCG
jgi:hypothetical protein